MQAQSKRHIKHGKEYDKYFPKSLGDVRVLGTETDEQDAVRHIKTVISRYHIQCAGIAPVLKGDTLRETCANIFRFVYEHIDYVPDELGYEQVRRPARLWADRKGDCDCYTVFIASILKCLHIPCKLRMTDYGEGYQHIYVIVPDSDAPRGYWTIDPVLDVFDDEAPNVYRVQDESIKPTAAIALSGLGNGLSGVIPAPQGFFDYKLEPNIQSAKLQAYKQLEFLITQRGDRAFDNQWDVCLLLECVAGDILYYDEAQKRARADMISHFGSNINDYERFLLTNHDAGTTYSTTPRPNVCNAEKPIVARPSLSEQAKSLRVQYQADSAARYDADAKAKSESSRLSAGSLFDNAKTFLSTPTGKAVAIAGGVAVLGGVTWAIVR